MPRQVALVVLWLVFAAAAVGVGFGAANLVRHPYADVAGDAGSRESVSTNSTPAPPSATVGTPSTATHAPPSSAASSGRRPVASSSSVAATPARRPTSPSAGPTGSRDPAGSGTGAQERSLTTRGGIVTATCRSGLVTLGASPAVGWRLDDVSDRPTEEGEVKFRRAGDAEGEVEVHVRCRAGTPAFELDDHGGGGDR